MNSIEPVPCEQPRVLVLLATFNGERWLDRQLRSIFGQEGVSVSVLVSDHGSNDGTVALVKQCHGTGEAIDLLAGTPPGGGSAANFQHLLREHSRPGFDYVALADQDDVWLPDRLIRAVKTIRRQGAVAYSSDVLAVWPDGRRLPIRKSQPQRRFDYLLEPAGPGCSYVMTAAFAAALRIELLAQPERFAGVQQHDWLIYSFARTHGHRWVIDDHLGIHYRQHAANEVGANVGLQGIRRRWHWARSGLYRRQLLHLGRLWPEAHADTLRKFERFGWADRCWLALRVRQLRRRPKDQLALFFMLLLGVLG
jgi:rhamnosyltransferase